MVITDQSVLIVTREILYAIKINYGHYLLTKCKHDDTFDRQESNSYTD